MAHKGVHILLAKVRGHDGVIKGLKIGKIHFVNSKFDFRALDCSCVGSVSSKILVKSLLSHNFSGLGRKIFQGLQKLKNIVFQKCIFQLSKRRNHYFSKNSQKFVTLSPLLLLVSRLTLETDWKQKGTRESPNENCWPLMVQMAMPHLGKCQKKFPKIQIPEKPGLETGSEIRSEIISKSQLIRNFQQIGFLGNFQRQDPPKKALNEGNKKKSKV